MVLDLEVLQVVLQFLYFLQFDSKILEKIGVFIEIKIELFLKLSFLLLRSLVLLFKYHDLAIQIPDNLIFHPYFLA